MGLRMTTKQNTIFRKLQRRPLCASNAFCKCCSTGEPVSDGQGDNDHQDAEQKKRRTNSEPEYTREDATTVPKSIVGH